MPSTSGRRLAGAVEKKYDGDTLARYAGDVGVDVSKLYEYRSVDKAYPAEEYDEILRCRKISVSVAKALMEGGPYPLKDVAAAYGALEGTVRKLCSPTRHKAELVANGMHLVFPQVVTVGQGVPPKLLIARGCILW